MTSFQYTPAFENVVVGTDTGGKLKFRVILARIIVFPSISSDFKSFHCFV